MNNDFVDISTNPRTEDDYGHQSYDGDIHEPDGIVWDPASFKKQKHAMKHEKSFVQVFGDGSSISERALGATTNQEELEEINRTIELH